MLIEKEKQSAFSPGPVLSEETLLRIVYYPAHIDEDGRLKPEAIPTQDLRERGFSVYRKMYVKREKIYRVIENYVAKKPERECRGISPILTKIVRDINDNVNKQAFHVLDDAKTKDNEAHAEIIYAQNYGRAEQKGLRNKLRDEFTAIREVGSVCEELGDLGEILNKNIATKSNNFFLNLWGKFFR